MVERRLRQLWDQLRGKKTHLPHFLSEIRLRGLRGIDDLRVQFDYPVSVIAGGNASGKSTVLFAAACAYKVPGAGVKDFVPSTLFPNYRPKSGRREDARKEIVIEFDYSTPDGQRSMRWRRVKDWNRSFLGRKDGAQPERPLYLRTLSNLSNPAEVRGVLGSMNRLNSPPDETRLTASQIAFAQQMLPFRYSEVVNLSSGSKNLLFAAQEGGVEYSELHMAAGERAILRMSQEIAQLEGALVLIDEVEAGLHPWVQQLLMLQLQQLALRNHLQIIVTSHSPVVLDSVPREGRIFLDRDTTTGEVSVLEPFRDVVQNALYGRSGDALNLLCEDDAAEGILQGVLDVLLVRESMRRESIRIGRDTGANEFPTHAMAFKKFGQIQNFVFVLDGDQRDRNVEEKIQAQAGSDTPVLYLPGGDAPEIWVWDRLRQNSDDTANALSITPTDLTERMNRLDSIYDLASDRPSEIAKEKLRELSDELGWDTPDICRTVARLEVGRKESAIQPLVDGLIDAFGQWRAG